MASRLILESSFLVDLDRDLRRGRRGPAESFLEVHTSTELVITFTVAGELAAGFARAQRRAWEDLLAPFQILPFSLDVAWHYGLAYRFLAENGLLIGTNDLWIAATALAHGLPLVTANPAHFRRVPGLETISYRP